MYRTANNAERARQRAARSHRQVELRRGLAALCRLLDEERLPKREALHPAAEQGLYEEALLADMADPADLSDPNEVASLSAERLGAVVGGLGVSPDTAGQLRAAAQCYLADASSAAVLYDW